MLKKGDLVKPKSMWGSNFQKKKSDLGVVVEIEKDFFQHNDYFQDRLTIYWTHGEKTQEPDGYVDKVNVPER
jgi:hypothetical protein